jgi:hypothetical protein
MRKPPRKRLVARGCPLILSNSLIFVVTKEMARIPRSPITKQITLEIRARTNHKNNEKRNSEPIISKLN